MPDYEDIRRLVRQKRGHIPELNSQQVRTKLAEGALLVDVRDEGELLHNPPLAGAVHLSRGRLEYLIPDAVSDKTTPIVLYCNAGLRSVLAADSLLMLGYQEVYVLQGGLQTWRQALGQPWFSFESRANAHNASNANIVPYPRRASASARKVHVAHPA